MHVDPCLQNTSCQTNIFDVRMASLTGVSLRILISDHDLGSTCCMSAAALYRLQHVYSMRFGL